jgi:hypothetical protein
MALFPTKKTTLGSKPKLSGRTPTSGHDPAGKKTGATKTTFGSTYDARKGSQAKKPKSGGFSDKKTAAKKIRAAAKKKRAAERDAARTKKKEARAAKKDARAAARAAKKKARLEKKGKKYTGPKPSRRALEEARKRGGVTGKGW